MAQPIDYARRIVKGSTLVFTFSIVAALTGLALRLFLARTLSMVEYGSFYAIVAFVSLFMMFRGMGLGTALVKHIPEFQVQKRFGAIKSSIFSALALQGLFALIIAATLFIFADYIAVTIFGTLDVALPLRIMSIWFFVGMFYYLFHEVFRGFQNIKLYAPMEFLNILFVLLPAIVFIRVLGFGVEGVALAYLTGAVLIGFLTFGLLSKNYSHILKEKGGITKPIAKKLLLFGLPVLVSGFAGTILGYIDTISITVFRSLGEVGLYQSARPLTEAIGYLPAALTVILLPVVSELWERGEKKMIGNFLGFLLKFSFILIIPVVLIFVAFPEIVIRLLFGGSFLGASVTLQILSISVIFYMGFSILTNAIIGVGKPGALVKIMVVMATFNLVGNILLVPTVGIEGAAIATTASYLLGLLLAVYFARKLMKLAVPVSGMLKSLSGGGLVLALILGLKSVITLHPWLTAVLVLIPSFLLYGLWLFGSGAITKRDLGTIKQIVPIPKPIFEFCNRITRR